MMNQCSHKSFTFTIFLCPKAFHVSDQGAMTCLEFGPCGSKKDLMCGEKKKAFLRDLSLLPPVLVAIGSQRPLRQP
jgi:hypothetical protein